jgi:transposase
MEKEKEFFEKMRLEKIDNLIKKLNELKDFNSMCAFRTDRDFYKKDIDDIFNSFDDGNNYLSMKKFFEQN